MSGSPTPPARSILLSFAAVSYRVIARKYRPRTFSEVVGQDHIVTALSRAIERDRLGQAYLLVGPRGVGKTSTARIIAKSLNCEQGPSVTPCLQCDICREIELGSDMDVVEIDGASNNGVDDVRAIRERVHFLPLRDRRKIYIIDEVQRLSGPAFDALLKTLEEPPGHVVFLFATTDPHKIPETITSRCQTFEFRRLREEDIVTKLRLVCTLEEVEVPDEVLIAIAGGCRGGLRDAESMLDQLLAVAEGVPTLDDLEMVAGLARPERWLELFEAVERDDAPQVLKSVDDFLQRGGSERDLISQAVDALRDLLHIVLLGEDAVGTIPSAERKQRTMDLARAFGRDRVETLLGMMFTLEGRMRQAPLAARALLEWTLLRASRLGSLLATATLAESLQAGGLSVPADAADPAPVRSASTAAAADAPSSPSAPEPIPESPAPQVAVTVKSLLALAAQGQPGLAQILSSRMLGGEVREDEVLIELGVLSQGDRQVVEDPASLAFLSRLDGSSGPWKILIEDPVEALPDPVGEQLNTLFGGTEEVT
ncbi:MAG: DNA polymerase III, subunit gamma and tau [Planctomycetota bacterium]|nr:MAG: DNA polymerase III, subunit gamma and tau [Planctomycetota bacterium]